MTVCPLQRRTGRKVPSLGAGGLCSFGDGRVLISTTDTDQVLPGGESLSYVFTVDIKIRVCTVLFYCSRNGGTERLMACLW